MKKIFLPIVICAGLFIGEASAATINSALVSDFENSIVTVTGDVEAGETGVTVLIMKKGESLKPGDLSGKNATIQNAVITGNTYEASFKFVAEEGAYSVYVGNSDTPYDFEYVEKKNVLQFVDDLGKKKVSESEIFAKLEKYGPSIGVNVDFADTETKEKYVAKNVLEYSERIAKDGLTGVKNVITLIKSELEFVEKLNQSPTASSVNLLIEEYKDIAEIDVTTYNTLTDNEKVKLCLMFVEADYIDAQNFADYSNMKTFREDFEKQVSNIIDSRVNVRPGGSGGSGGAPSGLPVIVDKEPTGVIPGNEATPGIGTKIFDMFSDVWDTEWAWESILYAVDNGIMVGVGDNKFAPNDNLTREQFAKIITLAFGLYDPQSVSDYADVDTTHWASSYVASAKINNVMKGIDDKNFGIDRAISREDICVAIYRACEMAGYEFSNEKVDFTDYGEISDYAKEAVAKMSGNGIISGMGDGRFAPKSPATRAQAAKIIYYVLKR